MTTNTPLQALVTMNDPVYFEAAKALAKRMKNEYPDGVSRQISFGWNLAVGRRPDAQELAALMELYQRQLKNFENDTQRSEEISASPELSALAVVANTLLNLDLVLTK